jgi:hypothetical protein
VRLASQQGQKRGFAGTAGPHDGRHVEGLDGQTDVSEDHGVGGLQLQVHVRERYGQRHLYLLIVEVRHRRLQLAQQARSLLGQFAFLAALHGQAPRARAAGGLDGGPAVRGGEDVLSRASGRLQGKVRAGCAVPDAAGIGPCAGGRPHRGAVGVCLRACRCGADGRSCVVMFNAPSAVRAAACGGVRAIRGRSRSTRCVVTVEVAICGAVSACSGGVHAGRRVHHDDAAVRTKREGGIHWSC